jgi:hypothetical protein
MKISSLIKKAYYFDFQNNLKKNKIITHNLSWYKEDPSYTDEFGIVELDIDYILEGSVKFKSHIDLKDFLNDDNFRKQFNPSDIELTKKEIIKIFENPEKYDFIIECLPKWDKLIEQPEYSPDLDEGELKPHKNYSLNPDDYKIKFDKIEARFIGNHLKLFYEYHFE